MITGPTDRRPRSRAARLTHSPAAASRRRGQEPASTNPPPVRVLAFIPLDQVVLGSTTRVIGDLLRQPRS